MHVLPYILRLSSGEPLLFSLEIDWDHFNRLGFAGIREGRANGGPFIMRLYFVFVFGKVVLFVRVASVLSWHGQIWTYASS